MSTSSDYLDSKRVTDFLFYFQIAAASIFCGFSTISYASKYIRRQHNVVRIVVDFFIN